MDKESLIDILNQTRGLNHMEYHKAERLKKKAASAIRVLLPTERSAATTIEQISFTSQFGFTSPDFERQTFYRGKDELEAILEAKIQVLNYIDVQLRKEKEQSSVSPKASSPEPIKSKAQEEEIEKIKSDLRKANDEIKDLKNEVKLAKKFRIIKELTTVFILIAGGFATGSVVVGIKVDYDKRELQNKVDKQNDSLKALNEKILMLSK